MTYIRLLLLSVHALISSILALLSALLDKTYRSYVWVAKFFSTGILFISGIKLNVKGLENLEQDGVYILVSNHASMYDIVTIQKGMPLPLSMYFKKELAKIPIFGWQLYLGPYVLIDRQNAEKAKKSMNKAKFLVEQKRFSVLLFAEGTRSTTGEIQPFKRGAFNLAAQLGKPVLPLTIVGTNKIMPKKTFKLHPGEITLIIDKPIPTTEVKTRSDEIALMNKVRDIIIKNYNNEVNSGGK